MKNNSTTIRIALSLFYFLVTGNAQAQEAVTIDQLRNELAARDKVIIDLLQRVEELESRLAPQNENRQLAGQVEETAVSATAGTGRSSASGFDIDELAAERALERSLVQQGTRLLGPGQTEITLGSAYSHNEVQVPALLALEGNNFVGEINQQTDVLDWNAGFRVGLPFNSQLEINIPYRSVHIDNESRINGAVQSSTSVSAAGQGDVRVALASRLSAEKSWRPHLVGRLEWITGTGDQQDNGVALGGSNKAVGAQLNASWRRDPVVFFIGGGYTYYFDADSGEVKPSDSLDLSLGAALALSPETALTFSIDQSFADELERDDTELPGTDRQSSLFNVSASTALARGLLLRFNAGVGLTDDAPDYRVDISLPWRVDFY